MSMPTSPSKDGIRGMQARRDQVQAADVAWIRQQLNPQASAACPDAEINRFIRAANFNREQVGLAHSYFYAVGQPLRPLQVASLIGCDCTALESLYLSCSAAADHAVAVPSPVSCHNLTRNCGDWQVNLVCCVMS